MRPQKKQVARVETHAQMAPCSLVGVGEKQGHAGGRGGKEHTVGDGSGSVQKMKARGDWRKWG